MLRFDEIYRLEKPKKRIDVVIDTDAYNQVDDLFAISYLIANNDKLNLLGIYAAPFYSPPSLGRARVNASPKEGMQESYKCIIELLGVMQKDSLANIVKKGSDRFLKNEEDTVDSEARDDLISLARKHSKEEPLYIVAIASLVDIASALNVAADIADKIVLVWLGGHGLEWDTCDDFNASQDIAAVRCVFSSSAAVVQVPCKGVSSEFRISSFEFDYYLKDKNALCDYLHSNLKKIMALQTSKKHWSKPLWDVVAVAWLLDKEFMLDRVKKIREFGYDLRYKNMSEEAFIRYVYSVDKDLLCEDLFESLKNKF